MKIIEEIKSIKDLVTSLLTKYEYLRDDDPKLIANIWHKQLVDKKISGMDLLLQFSEGNMVNPESIRRCRQKVQEANPELRGRNYKLRSKHSEEVRDQIKNF